MKFGERFRSGLSALALCSAVMLGVASPSARAQELVLVEAESFDDLGGWVLDQQFMDLMGSPYLLAHGMGRPVEDAATSVTLPGAGRYRLWVRTRDWVAPWGVEGAPGRFQVLIDGEPSGVTFGTEGEPWQWQDGGLVDVSAGSVQVTLHDLTGFEGRCDAVLLARDLGFRPPDDADELARFRRQVRGLAMEPVDAGAFDLVVVGGGVAGTAAAVTAARQGLSVALIQDRPVLGGNSSSEVRVWPEGHVNQMPYPRIGDVVMELVPEKRKDSKNAQGPHVFDDDRKIRVARAEPNLTLFLENRMNRVEVDGGRVIAVAAEHVRTGVRARIAGRWFADCTGDGTLGFLAGADFEQTDEGHMGASNLWNIRCLCDDLEPLSSEMQEAVDDAAFPRVPWAVDLSDKPFPGRDWGKTVPERSNGPISIGNWYWENGFDRDPIADMERIRDQNFRAMYGAWDAIKNVEGRYPAHRLNWVAYIAGKRESRRLMGDVLVTAEDLRTNRKWEDGCFPCTWGIDTHHPDTRYAEGHDGDEFIADFTRGKGYEYERPYWVPYRSLYSRNVPNLFMAGRDISVTHEALGAVRVMKTTGAMGEIVGLAASICAEEDCDPRDVYAAHWDDMTARMRVGAGRVPTVAPRADGSIALQSRSARIHGTSLRYEDDQDCLGYWRVRDDHPEWAFEWAKPGRATLKLTYACVPTEAGSTIEVRIDGRSAAEWTLVPTGGWTDYLTVELDAVELAAGAHRLSVHGDKEAGPLMKLRAIELAPVR
ncbi:MAG: FAD-dependent oxidoreductase [Planctomycetota bacterium]|nr:FAD-dependent oxidoreductase [Planctomycetota bacterium]MDA0932504.1 FAD-dependent oxidoreductase [Planctomycetota bacterium]